MQEQPSLIGAMDLSIESTSCDNGEAQEIPDSETQPASEDKEFEAEEKVCLNVPSETSSQITGSHADSDSNEELQVVRVVSPKIERSANLSLPKTTLLGKLKAKQRLNAFLALRPTMSCASPQKKFKDCEEGGTKTENKASTAKKTNKKFPDDIAKAVIEEIEMMKKVEIAMIESIEQDIYEKSQRKSRSRSKSRSRERGGRYKEQSYRRYKSHSRSIDKRSRYLEKESYPKNWTEMKEKHLKLEDVKEIKLHTSRHQKKNHECQDFRKQALFSKPSQPLKPLIIKGVTGQDKIVPVGYIRYTRANPSISYNVNFVKVKDVHVSEKEVCDMAPKSHKEILVKLKDTSAPSKSFESPKKSPRKWYLKTPLANAVDVTECELLEPSLGLSILQNYTDEEEDEEKYEVVVDEIAETSGPKIQTNAEVDTVVPEIKEDKKVETNKDVDVAKQKNSRNKKDASVSDQDGKLSESLQQEKPLLGNISAKDLTEEPKKKKHDGSRKTESKKSSKKDKTEHAKRDRKEKYEKKKKKAKSKRKKERTVDREEDKDKAKKSRETEKKTGCEDKSDKKSESKKLTTEKSSKRKAKSKSKEPEPVDDVIIKNDFNFETHVGNVGRETDGKKSNHDDESTTSKEKEMIEKIDKVKEDGKELKEEEAKKVIPCEAKEEKVQCKKSEDSCVKEDKVERRKSEDLCAKSGKKANEDADAVVKTDEKKRTEGIKQVELFKKYDGLRTRHDDVIKTDGDLKKESGDPKPEGNIKSNASDSLKVDDVIINVKEESDLRKSTDEVIPRNSKAEPELRTPDTEEYHSHWESDEDVSNAISYSPSRKPNDQIANTSWESDEEVVKNVPFHKQKTRGRYVEVSPPRSLDRRTRKLLDAPEVERSLEMPLNIKHLSRRKLENDIRDHPLGVLYSEDSWERGEYLKLRNDIETEKLKQERESLSEERRLLEKEKRKLAEKLEQVTSNLVYRSYEGGAYTQEIIDTGDSELRSIQQKRKELLGRRRRERKDKEKEKKTNEPETQKLDGKSKTVNVESNQFKLEAEAEENVEATPEVNSFGITMPKLEVVKQKRRKKRWESVDMDMGNKLSIDHVLIEEATSRAMLDDHENKPSIDEVLVGNTKPIFVEHKQLSLADGHVENKIDKQNTKEQGHPNDIEIVLNKISREIIPEPLTSNPVAPVNKVVILESEYEEFMKAVTSENYKDEELIMNREDKPGADDEHKTKFKSEKKKKKRKRSTSSSSSSSSSSYSSGTDSSSSSYSSTSTTSSSSSDDEKRHKKKGKRKSKFNKSAFGKAKGKHNIIDELDIEELKEFPILKDSIMMKDNMVIHKIKTESGLDILPGAGMENGEIGKAIDFSVPLPVPSPAVIPPLHMKMTVVNDESPISSTKIDSTTSPTKKPTLIPTKFLTPVVRKQHLDVLLTKESTQQTVNSNLEANFSNSFQAAAVQYPILDENCHTSFSLSLKHAVSPDDPSLNENSRSQDFTDLFAKKTETDKPSPVQEERPPAAASEIVSKTEPKEVVCKTESKPPESAVRLNKRERSLSPFAKKRETSPRSVSPKRSRNLSPRHNRSVSPKRSRNLSPRWSPLNSSPKRSRMTSPRPTTRNRDLSSRSVSPKRPRKSDNSRRRSPPRRHLSEREYSPRRRNLSPRRSISPPRYRDPRKNYSPRRNASPHRTRGKNPSPRYRSVSPRYRDASPGGRWCYSPRGRDVSPRRRNYSPRRRRSPSPRNRRYSFSRSPSMDRCKKEPIQLTLQRLAGLEDYTSASIKSPINSPLDGFKRSLADSTISDDQLLQQNSEEFTESPRNPPGLYFENKSMDLPCSPKRIPLDERISFVLGMEKDGPKPINTTYSAHYAYNQYGGVQYNHFTNYANQILQKPNYVISGMSSCNEEKSSTKVVQIGNVLEVVPTENIQSIPSPSKEYVPQQKILQVGNMLQIVPAPRITTMESSKPHPVTTGTPPCVPPAVTSCIMPSPVEGPNPVLSPSFFAVEKLSPEALMKQKISERKAQRQLRHEEREKKRREKEKRRKEKEKQRQIRIKQKTDNMIKQAILLETEALALGEELENQETTPDGECTTSEYWPGMPVIVSNPAIRPAGKGILVSGKFGKQNVDEDGNYEARKSVTFADGVVPGEGTSPSGGEELSSPPPMKIPLPKEKRYTKMKRQKKIKVPKKKKIKVKIIRKALDSQDDDSEDDNLPPPSPPPGSPPPHIFPPRIKAHTINNIHPSFISGMQSFPVHQFRPNMSVNMPLPPHGPPPPHGLPLLGHNLPQQGPPHSSARHMSLPHEAQFQQHSGLPHPPPPGLHH